MATDADLLDLVELITALDDLDIAVAEEEFDGIETVGQAYDRVKGKAGS